MSRPRTPQRRPRAGTPAPAPSGKPAAEIPAAPAPPQPPARSPRPVRLPILPLRRNVLFPFTMTALVIDNPAGVRLVDQAVPKTRLVALVPVDHADGEPVVLDALKGAPACVGRIVKVLRFPDGTLRVLVRGIRRAAMKSLAASEPYPEGVFTAVPEIADAAPDVQAMVNNLTQQFQQFLALSPHLPDELKVALLNLEDSGRLADLIANTINLSFAEKRLLLATAGVRERLDKASVFLTRELELLKLGSEIQSKVSSTFSKQQRDMFLREQLRAIQEQLGEEQDSPETAALRKRLEEAKLPDEARAAAERELAHMRRMHPQQPDFNVARNYLEWLLALPWTTVSEDRLDQKEAAALLDAEHYGLAKVKERILEFLAVRQLKGNAQGSILCLAGPPGVGKTSFGQSIAKAMGREFVRVSLGGIRDEAEIRGHRRTYVGALPGRILQGLRRAKTANPVFMLDEIDKIGADFRGDPSAALLEALDPQQNRAFSDHYLEVPFDLSRVFFITTANLVDPIIPALKDRLEILEIPGYTPNEKREIARRFLLPRQLAACGLDAAAIRVPDATLDAIVSQYTGEAGVRNLERELGRICRRLARRQVEGALPAKGKAFTVTAARLPDLLGPRRLFHEKAAAKPLAGVATGLAWTSAGGEVLQVEADAFAGSGQLLLTGSLGDVMKESARIALTCVRSRAAELKITPDAFKKRDFHIHVPAGATPKDGPSAGITLAVALASLLGGRPVLPFLAMTGELSLRGRVLPVGGIKEKVLAAARAGVKTVILPEANRQDLEDVPREIRDRLRFIPVADVAAVFRAALAPSRR